MKRASIALALGVLLTASLTADFRSTFLIDGKASSSLGYLSPELSDTKRENLRAKLIGLGDTHIDIYTRSTDPSWPVVNGVGDTWSNELQTLNDAGLSPVIWLRSDDSPEIDALPISDQLDYNDRVVSSVDSQVSHYIACLECNEYYSVPELNVVIQRLRKVTDKPIGVHLTPGMRGKEAYIQSSDVLYLQTGFGLSEAQFRAEIEYALTLGKPVVVSEYHMDGQSAEARRLGSIACSYSGVVGTGNGRETGSVCESLQEEVKVKFVDRYDDELAVFALALVFLSATYGLKANLPFTANFNYVVDDKYEVVLAAPINETTSAGVTVRDDGRIMAFITGSFNKLFGEYRGVSREERK